MGVSAGNQVDPGEVLVSGFSSVTSSASPMELRNQIRPMATASTTAAAMAM